jgi:hypothetical protein
MQGWASVILKITFFMITRDKSRIKITSRFDISWVRDYHAFSPAVTLLQQFGMYCFVSFREPANIHVPCMLKGRPERAKQWLT